MKQITATICFLLSVLGIKAQGTFTIEGRLTGVEDGTVIWLACEEGQILKTFACDTLTNGSFYIQAKTSEDESERMMIMVRRDKSFPGTYLEVWVAPDAQVKIQGEGKLLSTWRVNSNVKEQVLQNKYIDSVRELLDCRQRLSIRRNELWEIIDGRESTVEQREAARAEMHRNDAKSDSIRCLESPSIIKLLQDNPVDKAWMQLMYLLSMEAKLSDDFIYRKEAEMLYFNLSETVKQTDVGKNISGFLFPPKVVSVGEQIADADFYDLERNIHHLSEFKGKFILLDFWSRGCGPCAMSVPELRQISDAYKDQMVVVSLSTDNEKMWREGSLDEKEMNWANWNEMQGSNGLYAKYGATGLPFFVWISPEGKVLKKWSGYGKNSLKLRMIELLKVKRGDMRIAQAQKGTKLVDYPTQKSSNADYLVIKRVELRDTATVIHMHAYYIPNNWLKFSSKAYLSTPDGQRYPIKHIAETLLDKRFFMPDSGEMELTLYFEPLPENTEVFDFKEGEGRGDWKLEGIRLSE